MAIESLPAIKLIDNKSKLKIKKKKYFSFVILHIHAILKISNVNSSMYKFAYTYILHTIAHTYATNIFHCVFSFSSF